jgi:hypothetical protein
MKVNEVISSKQFNNEAIIRFSRLLRSPKGMPMAEDSRSMTILIYLFPKKKRNGRSNLAAHSLSLCSAPGE